MATQTGPNIGIINNWAPGDNGWSTAMNASLRAQDALMMPNIINATTTTPPGSPTEGQCYIVASGATGAWSGKTNQIARWSAGLSAWEFFVPKNGWQACNQADLGEYIYTGAAWVLLGSQKLNVPQDYISGLKLIWNSATSISVASGSAFVQSLGRLVQPAATLTLSALSLSASTWYHVYLFESSGTPSIECVTTAPSAAYNGTARTKSGDTSRRYLGSVLTDGSGNVYNFSITANAYSWKNSINAAPFLVIGPGTATTSTNVSCAGAVPVTGMAATLVLANTSVNSADAPLGTSDMTGALSATNYLQYIGKGVQTTHLMPLDGSQQFNYLMTTATGGGGLFARVAGFIIER